VVEKFFSLPQISNSICKSYSDKSLRTQIATVRFTNGQTAGAKLRRGLESLPINMTMATSRENHRSTEMYNDKN